MQNKCRVTFSPFLMDWTHSLLMAALLSLSGVSLLLYSLLLVLRMLEIRIVTMCHPHSRTEHFEKEGMGGYWA